MLLPDPLGLEGSSLLTTSMMPPFGSRRVPSEHRRIRGELRRIHLLIHLLRLYEKPSTADQPPHHEADHGSIYERFAACTQPLVVFAHPAVMVDPGKGAFHYPAARQDLKSIGCSKSLCQSAFLPSLANSCTHVTLALPRGQVCADLRLTPHSIQASSQCPVSLPLFSPL